jgi:hypothetical protein
MGEVAGMRERWKIIYKYYEVSSNGRFCCKETGKFLKGHTQRYISMSLARFAPKARKYLHQLVAEAFLGPCPAGKEVNHKDGVKTNCRLSNLEYKTHRGNEDHAVKLGLKAHGERNGNSKLTVLKVQEIRRLRRKGFSQADVARKFGVWPQVVALIVSRKTWRRA